MPHGALGALQNCVVWHAAMLCCATTLQARAAKLQDARAVREYEELRECTFTPEINRSVPDFGKVRRQSEVWPGARRLMPMSSAWLEAACFRLVLSAKES